MVVAVDVGVDAHRTGAEVEHPHLAEPFEIVHRLVHGLQRDRRHLGARPFVQRLDRRVAGVAVQQAEDRLALRRDPQPPLAEQVGELLAGLHDSDILSTILVDKQLGATSSSTRDIRASARPMLR